MHYEPDLADGQTCSSSPQMLELTQDLLGRPAGFPQLLSWGTLACALGLTPFPLGLHLT